MVADDAALKRARVTIKVIGVGGGGNSVLMRMAKSDFIREQNIEDIELIGINTDAKQLARLNAQGIPVLQIGDTLTHGRGTGGNAAIGEQAAKSDEARIKKVIEGADLVFITAGMGAGTGTGAVPVVSKIAKDLGVLTIGVVTLPFKFEGSRKMRIAKEGTAEMQSYMDALLAIHNDNLMKLPENRKLTLVNAFKLADQVLEQAILCIAELILKTGVINVDFADVTTIFRQSDSSDALLGIGASKNSAVDAVKKAIESPLLDKSLKGARGVILNLSGDKTMSLCDVNDASEYICAQTDPNVNIILGTVIDEKLKGEIRATIIATDFAGSEDSLDVPSMGKPLAAPAPAAKKREFDLEPPAFMQKKNSQAAPAHGAFAIPAFKLTPDMPSAPKKEDH